MGRRFLNKYLCCLQIFGLWVFVRVVSLFVSDHDTEFNYNAGLYYVLKKYLHRKYLSTIFQMLDISCHKKIAGHEPSNVNSTLTCYNV